jgi:hypothetical protein
VPFPPTTGLYNPPPAVWGKLIRSIRSTSSLRLGACVACYLELNNHGNNRRDPEMSDYKELIESLIRQGTVMERAGDSEAAKIVSYIVAEIKSSRVQPPSVASLAAQ